jgi:hypothetical protein
MLTQVEGAAARQLQYGALGGGVGHEPRLRYERRDGREVDNGPTATAGRLDGATGVLDAKLRRGARRRGGRVVRRRA